MDEFLPVIKKNLDYYSHRAKTLLRHTRYRLAPVQLEQPVFVIGCSRAGTTLVYKTFSESSELGSLQKETHAFWAGLHPPAEKNWDTHEIPDTCANERDRSAFTRYMYSETGKLRIVDKNNQNGLSVSYLHRLFPDAHFVFIKRNPGDNINSLIHGWGKADEYGVWSDELPERVSIDNGEYKRWCFFLSKGWREYTETPIEEVCAFQYRSMNQAILRAKLSIPEMQWHELVYETVIEQPVEEFRRVFEACGLAFDDHLFRHCSEVIAKPYNAFSEIKIDKWKQSRNRERIERVLPALKDIVDKLGYSQNYAPS